MPILNIPQTYRAGQRLRKTDLDGIVSSIETFVNTTKLDTSNLNITSIISSLTATQANDILSAANSTGADELINKASAAASSNLIANSTFSDDTQYVFSSDSAVTSTDVTVESLTTNSNGTYLITGSISKSTTTEATVRLKNGSDILTTWTAEDSIASNHIIETLTASDVITLTVDMASGSDTAETQLTLVRLY